MSVSAAVSFGVPALAFDAQVGVSAAVVVVLILTGWLVRHRPGPVRKWTESRVGVVALALALALVVVASGLVLVVAWDAVEPAERALAAAQVTVENGVRLLLSIAVVAGAYILTGMIRRLIDEFATDREHITRHQSEIIYRTTQVVVYVTMIIAALGIWNVDLGGLLIGAGFLGIVVGMAARQTLGALLSGFVLMFSRPFELGDWVEIGDDEGIVMDITIVDTRMQTFDGEYVVIPNDNVSGSTIRNLSRKGRLRLHVEVGVDYDADVERAADVAEAAMRDLEDVLSVPKPDVVLERFGDSAVILGLRFWIDKPNARRKWRAQTAVIAAVKEAFEAEGIEIPFPQRELGARKDGGFSLTGEGDDAGTTARPQADGGEQ